MKKELIYVVLIIAAAISSATAGLPPSFYSAMSSMDNKNVLCVKNYEAGASFTESYTGFEYLEKDTQVVSRSPRGGGSCRIYDSKNCSILEARINSKVIGRASIAWVSKDPRINDRGRHSEWGRLVEELKGAFTIERFVQLWGNSTCGEISTDWMPCV
jgi:hypothetical protein